LPDELPARPSDRAALFNQRYFEELSPDLSHSHSMVPGGLCVRS
jgi:hypothetical protein